MMPDPYPAVRLGFSLCKPTSEGSISIQSADSSVPPKFLETISPLDMIKNYDFWNEINAQALRNKALKK